MDKEDMDMGTAATRKEAQFTAVELQEDRLRRKEPLGEKRLRSVAKQGVREKSPTLEQKRAAAYFRERILPSVRRSVLRVKSEAFSESSRQMAVAYYCSLPEHQQVITKNYLAAHHPGILGLLQEAQE